MSSWTITPAEKQFISEFDGLNPDRDKGADGTIGDSSHDSTSDHTPDEDSSSLKNRDSDNINEVHAVDIDSTGPWPDTTFDEIVKYIWDECKKPNDVGKDYGRIRYFIWDHHIYEAKNGWAKNPYSGSDPHTNHGHFSFEYDTGYYENDDRPYGILETFGGGVSKQEVVEGLTEYFGPKVTYGDYKGKPNSKIGHDALGNGIPNPFNNDEQEVFWSVFNQMCSTVIELQSTVNQLAADLNAHFTGIKEEKLNGS